MLCTAAFVTETCDVRNYTSVRYAKLAITSFAQCYVVILSRA